MRKSCPNGHDVSGANGSWQHAGKGHLCRVCRKCNAARAKAWRADNARRLARLYPGNGLQLAEGKK